MIKKLLVLFALLALTTTGVASVAQGQDTVTINWWHIQTIEEQGAVWEQVAEDYMAVHPNVEIEMTVLENEAFKSRIVTVMQAGDPPDLFQAWGGGTLWEFADAGMLRDISPELDADDGAWRNSFSAQAALELFGKDGEYYGVPWNWGAVGMFYNKALFEQAGLDPENPPATWEEFLAAVQALKDAGITPIALGESEKWTGHFWWVYLAIRTGGEEAFLAAYNRDGAFTDEPFVEAGEYLQELIALDPFPEGFMGLGYGDQAGIMGDGMAGMELMGQWAPGSWAGLSESGGEGIGDNAGWFPFPAVGEDSHEGVLGGGDGFAVGRDAPDEAVDFLRYLTSPEVQRMTFWAVPTVAEAEDMLADDPVMMQILEARNTSPYSQLYYDQFLPPAVGEAVNDAVAGLFAGEYSPQDVAEIIEDEASFELD